MKDMRILAIADNHSGHRIGLTPPFWQHYPDKYIELRQLLWNYFIAQVKYYGPFDLVLHAGDGVEGKGERSGSTELITADRIEQARMAVEIFRAIDCRIIRMVYGTPYHVGCSEDFEDVIIEMLLKEGFDAKIRDQVFLNINNRIISMKHKVGSSALPHLRLTAIAREILQNRMWAMKGVQPLADILLRAHVHYKEEMRHDGCVGIVMPALQGLGGKYGARQCMGTVDFGIVVINISKDGEIIWMVPTIEGKMQADMIEMISQEEMNPLKIS